MHRKLCQFGDRRSRRQAEGYAESSDGVLATEQAALNKQKSQRSCVLDKRPVEFHDTQHVSPFDFEMSISGCLMMHGAQDCHTLFLEIGKPSLKQTKTKTLPYETYPCSENPVLREMKVEAWVT